MTHAVAAEITRLASSGQTGPAACLADAHLRHLEKSPASPIDYALSSIVQAFEDGGAIAIAEDVQAQVVAAAARSTSRIALRHAQERHADLLIKLRDHGRAEALLAELEGSSEYAAEQISHSDIFALHARNSRAKGDRAAMRRHYDKALAYLAPYGGLSLRDMRVEYARALAADRAFAAADALFVAALAPGEYSEPGRPDASARRMMAERAKVLEALGRRDEAEFHALPARVAAAYEARDWAEAARLTERMAALAPRVAGIRDAAQMAREFQAALRNRASGNVPPPYTAPKQLQLCGPWDPPASASVSGPPPIPVISTRAAAAKEDFAFAWFPVRAADPEAALFRAIDRYQNYAAGCAYAGKPAAGVAVLEGARKLLADAGYAEKDFEKLLRNLERLRAIAAEAGGATSP